MDVVNENWEAKQGCQVGRDHRVFVSPVVKPGCAQGEIQPEVVRQKRKKKQPTNRFGVLAQQAAFSRGFTNVALRDRQRHVSENEYNKKGLQGQQHGNIEQQPSLGLPLLKLNGVQKVVVVGRRFQRERIHSCFHANLSG